MAQLNELFEMMRLKERSYEKLVGELDSEKLDDESSRIRAQAVEIHAAASAYKSQIYEIILNETYLSYLELFKKYPPEKDKFDKNVPFRRLGYLQQRRMIFDADTVQKELTITPEEWAAILARGDYIELINTCVESGSLWIDKVYERIEASNTKGIGQWGQNLSARLDQFISDYGQLLSDEYSDISTWPEQIQSGYDDYGQIATKAQATLSGVVNVLNQMSSDIVDNQKMIKDQLEIIKANKQAVESGTAAAADSDKLMRDHNSAEQRALKALDDAQQKLVSILKDKDNAEKAARDSEQKLRDIESKISANKDIIEEQTRTIVTLRNAIISTGQVAETPKKPAPPADPSSSPEQQPAKPAKDLLREIYKKRPVRITCPRCGNEFDHKRIDPTAKCGKCKMSIGIKKYLDGGYPKASKPGRDEDAHDTAKDV